MDKEQLLKIKESELFSLGLHTASHIDFSALTKNEIAVDITNNFNYFKDELLMEAVSGISYPYGLISETEINKKIKPSVVGLGVKYGLTTHKGINDNLNNPLFLKRFDANDVVGGKKPIISF
jgi:peptidoglycan/xylan/chitin deacetylase (PgdA/CDA1 family)